ncbi:MAG: hypothetical protein ACE365_03555 [Gammaproteobacteria bacterium]
MSRVHDFERALNSLNLDALYKRKAGVITSDDEKPRRVLEEPTQQLHEIDDEEESKQLFPHTSNDEKSELLPENRIDSGWIKLKSYDKRVNDAARIPEDISDDFLTELKLEVDNLRKEYEQKRNGQEKLNKIYKAWEKLQNEFRGDDFAETLNHGEKEDLPDRQNTDAKSLSGALQEPRILGKSNADARLIANAAFGILQDDDENFTWLHYYYAAMQVHMHLDNLPESLADAIEPYVDLFKILREVVYIFNEKGPDAPNGHNYRAQAVAAFANKFMTGNSLTQNNPMTFMLWHFVTRMTDEEYNDFKNERTDVDDAKTREEYAKDLFDNFREGDLPLYAHFYSHICHAEHQSNALTILDAKRAKHKLDEPNKLLGLQAYVDTYQKLHPLTSDSKDCLNPEKNDKPILNYYSLDDAHHSAVEQSGSEGSESEGSESEGSESSDDIPLDPENFKHFEERMSSGCNAMDGSPDLNHHKTSEQEPENPKENLSNDLVRYCLDLWIVHKRDPWHIVKVLDDALEKKGENIADGGMIQALFTFFYYFALQTSSENLNRVPKTSQLVYMRYYQEIEERTGATMRSIDASMITRADRHTYGKLLSNFKIILNNFNKVLEHHRYTKQKRDIRSRITALIDTIESEIHFRAVTCKNQNREHGAVYDDTYHKFKQACDDFAGTQEYLDENSPKGRAIRFAGKLKISRLDDLSVRSELTFWQKLKIVWEMREFRINDLDAGRHSNAITKTIFLVSHLNQVLNEEKDLDLLSQVSLTLFGLKEPFEELKSKSLSNEEYSGYLEESFAYAIDIAISLHNGDKSFPKNDMLKNGWEKIKTNPTDMKAYYELADLYIKQSQENPTSCPSGLLVAKSLLSVILKDVIVKTNDAELQSKASYLYSEITLHDGDIDLASARDKNLPITSFVKTIEKAQTCIEKNYTAVPDDFTNRTEDDDSNEFGRKNGEIAKKLELKKQVTDSYARLLAYHYAYSLAKKYPTGNANLENAKAKLRNSYDDLLEREYARYQKLFAATDTKEPQYASARNHHDIQMEKLRLCETSLLALFEDENSDPIHHLNIASVLYEKGEHNPADWFFSQTQSDTDGEEEKKEENLAHDSNSTLIALRALARTLHLKPRKHELENELYQYLHLAANRNLSDVLKLYSELLENDDIIFEKADEDALTKIIQYHLDLFPEKNDQHALHQQVLAPFISELSELAVNSEEAQNAKNAIIETTKNSRDVNKNYIELAILLDKLETTNNDDDINIQGKKINELIDMINRALCKPEKRISAEAVYQARMVSAFNLAAAGIDQCTLPEELRLPADSTPSKRAMVYYLDHEDENTPVSIKLRNKYILPLFNNPELIDLNVSEQLDLFNSKHPLDHPGATLILEKTPHDRMILFYTKENEDTISKKEKEFDRSPTNQVLLNLFKLRYDNPSTVKENHPGIQLNQTKRLVALFKEDKIPEELLSKFHQYIVHMARLGKLNNITYNEWHLYQATHQTLNPEDDYFQEIIDAKLKTLTHKMTNNYKFHQSRLIPYILLENPVAPTSEDFNFILGMLSDVELTQRNRPALKTFFDEFHKQITFGIRELRKYDRAISLLSGGLLDMVKGEFVGSQKPSYRTHLEMLEENEQSITDNVNFIYGGEGPPENKVIAMLDKDLFLTFHSHTMFFDALFKRYDHDIFPDEFTYYDPKGPVSFWPRHCDRHTARLIKSISIAESSLNIIEQMCLWILSKATDYVCGTWRLVDNHMRLWNPTLQPDNRKQSRFLGLFSTSTSTSKSELNLRFHLKASYRLNHRITAFLFHAGYIDIDGQIQSELNTHPKIRNLLNIIYNFRMHYLEPATLCHNEVKNQVDIKPFVENYWDNYTGPVDLSNNLNNARLTHDINTPYPELSECYAKINKAWNDHVLLYKQQQANDSKENHSLGLL